MVSVKTKIDTAKIASRALARINFFEGESLLKRGEARAAITQFREAINNDEKNDQYYYKLALTLAADENSMAEAREALLKAIALNKNNPDYQAQLGLLYKKSGGEAIPVKERHIKRHIETVSPAIKPARVGRRKRKLRLVGKELIERPEGFKLINIIVLGLIVVFTLSALSLSLRASRFEIKLLIPEEKATLKISDIEFRWVPHAGNIDYLIQVETNGKKVLERYTRANRYVPTIEEMSLFKPGYRYQWRVVPISPKRRPLAFKTNDREFKVSIAKS